MFDELFEGNPRDKAFEIIFGANPSVVSSELEMVFEQFCALKILASKVGISDESVASLLHTTEQKEKKNDFYIDLVSGILSKNE